MTIYSVSRKQLNRPRNFFGLKWHTFQLTNTVPELLKKSLSKRVLEGFFNSFLNAFYKNPQIIIILIAIKEENVFFCKFFSIPRTTTIVLT